MGAGASRCTLITEGYILAHMVFLVPYDGSPVSKAALSRAVEHGSALDEEIVAVAFIATGSDYTERRVWISPSEDFALESAQNELERKIGEATDDAERNFTDTTATSPQDLDAHIERVAGEVDASVLFVGTSKNGETSGLTTPFGTVEQQGDFDVHLVRTA